MKKRLIEIAKSCTSFEQVDNFLKQIETQYDIISDNLYYQLKTIALNSVYNYLRFGIENNTIYSI